MDYMLDPPEDDEPDILDEDAEPDQEPDVEGDWGSDEIERSRNRRYD